MLVVGLESSGTKLVAKTVGRNLINDPIAHLETSWEGQDYLCSPYVLVIHRSLPWSGRDLNVTALQAALLAPSLKWEREGYLDAHSEIQKLCLGFW